MNHNFTIVNGRIIDPVQHIDEIANISIKNGLIHKIESKSPVKNQNIIDAEGKWVFPGFVDMHVHFREPGREDKETILSGSMAAAAGGFTAVACMPNTDPVNDCQSVLAYILQKSLKTPTKVYPIAAITKRQEGIELVEMGELSSMGAVAFSDDGHCIRNAEVLRRALEYAQMFSKPIIEHCEDTDLSQKGVMNEGIISTQLGFQGIPSLAEELMVARDISITEYTNGSIHIAHVSTKNSLNIIHSAKKRGVKVTAEVTPHHLLLTEDMVTSFNTNFKMNPPLRTEEDRIALIKGIQSGTIDCIASDHAPHTDHEKCVEFNLAPNGIVGLETSVSLILTHFVHTGLISPITFAKLMSTNPCKILNIPGGSFKIGEPADITVIDPQLQNIVTPEDFKSKSRNTPFSGWRLKGKAVMTIVNGKIVFVFEQ